MQLYRNFTSQEEIDAEYRTDRHGADLPTILSQLALLSAQVRAELPCKLGLKYGPTRAERLDYFPARSPGAPVLLFIHGGYWRLGSAKDSSFVARGPVHRGIATIVTDYALCPAVSIDEITRQNRAALAWTWHHAAELGIDRERIYVAGHSAGGQQVGMLLATDWAADYDLPQDAIKGALAISGIYDLGPLRYSWLQPKLLLTHETIQRQSPLFHIPQGGPPLLVTCGGLESSEFLRQSAAYLAAWKARGLSGRFLEQPGADHFSAIRSFVEPDGLLTHSLVELTGI